MQTANQRIYTMTFSSVYPLYIKKVERKGRTKAEVDEIVHRLMGYSQHELEAVLEKQITFQEPLSSILPGISLAELYVAWK